MHDTRAFFDKLTEAKLTVNLGKSEIAQGTVVYLGHVVGQGQVRPIEAKIECINDFPVPEAKKPLMRFLGMAGFNRKLCRNFSQVVAPLTNLLKKNVKFVWNDREQGAFEKVKAILTSSPVLIAPDFQRTFKLYVDASDIGAGAVLQQEDAQGIDHPVCFYSRKFNKHQRNYSTVEKETLALVLVLQHLDVYADRGLHRP